MTPKAEFLLGVALWAKGVMGCLLTVYYVNKHFTEVITFFGAFIALGLCFIMVGALDWLSDDFHEDIKKEWKDGDKKKGDASREH